MKSPEELFMEHYKGFVSTNAVESYKKGFMLGCKVTANEYRREALELTERMKTMEQAKTATSSTDTSGTHSVRRMFICGFGLAWIGECEESVINEGERCENHKDEKCSSCGEPATHQCSETGQFVCGAPLCDNCEHTIAEDGTNGNIGFFRTAKLPDGYRAHCRKDEQIYIPWYAREDALGS